MQEQICPPTKVDSELALNRAILDLKFYWNLARQNGESFEVEIWAERGAIVLPQPSYVTRGKKDELCPSL